jgi:peptide/nickel transport system substrate-binding protein
MITRRSLLLRTTTLASAALALTTAAARAQQTGTPSALSTPPSVPKSGGTLRIGKPEDLFAKGAPYILMPGNEPLYNLVYNTLVKYDRQFQLQPQLASSWTWSSDSLQLTVQLRSDVTYHSGRPFTSDDARFNLERVRDPAEGSQVRNYAQLMHVTTPAPDQLVISYDTPVRSSFDALALTYMADQQTLDQISDGGPFIGTGPFRFQEWVQGDHVKMASNPHYWQTGRPYLDAVELHVLPDPQAAIVSLEAGALDWLTGVQGVDALRLQSDPGYQVMLTGGNGNFYYLGFDVTVPAFSNKLVRQAFGYALNRQRLVDTALFGFGRPASIPWHQQSLAYDANLDQTFSYDPARARQMLTAAGWDSSAVVPLIFPSGVQVTDQMAEIVQADLASVGVQVELQRAADFVPRLQSGRLGGAWIVSMGFTNLSPATLFTTAFSVRVPNSSNFASQQYQDLIDQTIAATDDQQLKLAAQEVTRLLLDEAFIVILAEGAGQLTGPVAARANVMDVTWDGLGDFAYQDVWLA